MDYFAITPVATFIVRNFESFFHPLDLAITWAFSKLWSIYTIIIRENLEYSCKPYFCKGSDSLRLTIYEYRKVLFLAQRHNDRFRQEIHKFLEASIITHSTSAWSLPVINSRRNYHNYRLCENNGKSNPKTEADCLVVTKVEDIFDYLSGRSVGIDLDQFEKILPDSYEREVQWNY